MDLNETGSRIKKCFINRSDYLLFQLTFYKYKTFRKIMYPITSHMPLRCPETLFTFKVSSSIFPESWRRDGEKNVPVGRKEKDIRSVN